MKGKKTMPAKNTNKTKTAKKKVVKTPPVDETAEDVKPQKTSGLSISDSR